MFPLANTGIVTAFLSEQDEQMLRRMLLPPTLGAVPGPKLHPPTVLLTLRPCALISCRGLRAWPGGWAVSPPWAHPASTHRTALMCSQDAVPDRGPFCSLVRPWTVSN